VKKSIFGIALTAMMMTAAVFTGCDGPARLQGDQGT